VKSLRWGGFLILGLLLPRITGLAPGLVEALYAKRLFPRITSALSLASGRLQFSLAQILIIAAGVIILWIVIHSLMVSVRERSLYKGFRHPHRWVAAAALTVWAFYGLWGLNYSRPTLTRLLSLEPVTPGVENLSRLTRTLSGEVNRTYQWAYEGRQLLSRARETSTVSQFLVARTTVGDRLEAAYCALEPSYAGRFLAPPKFPFLAAGLMSRAGISGFYFPLTGEANVNRRVPDVSVPFVMAHEMAHQRGTAREDEANFWAYLVCRETGLAAARYSGALEAFGIALNALSLAAPDSTRALLLTLDSGPRGDRAAIAEFWRRYQGPASRAATRVNDSYLKFNAQRAGVQSYGLAVRLLLALENSGGMEGE
jgi:hypothetical protein